MATFLRIVPGVKKFLAVGLSACFVWTSGGISEALNQAPDVFQSPSFLPQVALRPPERLGQITDYYNPNASAKNKKLVILIQDLHINYGVQKNISALLEFFAAKLTKGSGPASVPDPSRLPFALAVEGAECPIDTTVLAQWPEPQIKQAAMEYFLRR